MEAKKLQWVRGLLNAHWEYPGFLPDRKSGLKYMDFQLREEKWQQVYAKPGNDAYIHHPDETKCFRIIGQGYLAPRQPTMMQNWEGRQFIFVKIKKMELTSAAKCASRMKTNDRYHHLKAFGRSRSDWIAQLRTFAERATFRKPAPMNAQGSWSSVNRWEGRSENPDPKLLSNSAYDLH